MKIENGRSQLCQFLADPPTLTMQQLKGMTTDGLPTFANISKKIRDADIDDDSWLQQIVDVDIVCRGGVKRKMMVFVGDGEFR